jgi:two-component system, sensor histidine kinase and response regulator
MRSDRRTPPREATTARPKVLLVDDRRDNLLALSAVLEPLDVELVQADSGEEALRRLLSDSRGNTVDRYAVIVLDVQMPVLDGFETAALIKGRERTRHIPIIFLTAISGELEHHLRGYETGAADYVYKPFSPEILRAKVGVFAELWRRDAVIQRQKAELRARLTELDRANERLAAQAVELERSNTALERFAEVAAHELRQPLNNAAGFLDLLLARHADGLDGQARLLVEHAAKATGDMRALTATLLDYAKAGGEPLEVEPVPLGEVVEDARQEVLAQPYAADAKIHADELPVVQGDRRLLTRLFANLLDNAVKFRADEPPLVRVDANRDERGWTLCVRDNGIGVSAGDAPRLFTLFARVHPRDERPGHGVGLAVCRRIVERHGGTIWCQPPDPDGPRGTTICLTLPSQPDHQADRRGQRQAPRSDQEEPP